MRKRTPISVVSALAIMAIAGAATVLSSGAGAGRPPFVSIPAAANIAALSAAPVFATPAAVSRLSPDLRPSNARIHTLGTAGYAWQRDGGSVCVLMASGPGGCLSSFEKPVLLFLTGTLARDGSSLGAQQVSGLAPNSVKRLVLVTTSGDHIAAPITHNGFAADVPADAGVAGELITLANGTTFWNEDRLTAPTSLG